MPKMHTTLKWDSSSEEEEMSDRKYRMKLRDPLRTTQPLVESSTMENEASEPRRRGRGPSKRPCLNRNALMARENRQRKKAYVEKIENKLSFYQEENKTLVNTIRKQGIDIKRLTGEVAYLRSVLSNNTSIAALLKTINDGLRKIGPCKKDSIPSNDPPNSFPDSFNQSDKYSCPLITKQNGVRLQDHDTPINNTSPEKHMPDFRHSLPNPNCKNNASIMVRFSDPVVDHTYSILKNPIVYFKNELDRKEGSSLGTTVSSLSQESEDSYTDNIQDLDRLLPMAQSSLDSIDEKKDSESLSTDFDQLPSFNMDIFEDLPKCEEMMDTIEGLHDSATIFSEEEMFPNLDNTGICLHVNSDKVSLEYCSLCQSNSKGSTLGEVESRPRV